MRAPPPAGKRRRPWRPAPEWQGCRPVGGRAARYSSSSPPAAEARRRATTTLPTTATAISAATPRISPVFVPPLDALSPDADAAGVGAADWPPSGDADAAAGV